MYDSFLQLLMQKDFVPLSDCEHIYIRIENPVQYIVAVQKEDTPERREQVKTIAQACTSNLENIYCTHCICLYLIISTSETMANPLQQTDRLDSLHHISWCFCPDTQILHVSQDAPKKLLGIEKLLQMAVRGQQFQKDTLHTFAQQKTPLITYTILAICTLVLIDGWISGTHQQMLERYCIGRVYIEQGEYYRFLTSLFLHTDLQHLAANAIYLLYFGTRAEQVLGKVRFLFLYFVSGLCGSFCSLVFSGLPAVGASGAIFGIIGGMLVLTKKKGSHSTGMNYATMLLLCCSGLVLGFLNTRVDNWAHIGGFISGAVLFLAMMYQVRNL